MEEIKTLNPFADDEYAIVTAANMLIILSERLPLVNNPITSTLSKSLALARGLFRLNT